MPPTGVLSEIDPATLAAYSQRILGSKMGASRIAPAGRKLGGSHLPLSSVNRPRATAAVGRQLDWPTSKY